MPIPLEGDQPTNYDLAAAEVSGTATLLNEMKEASGGFVDAVTLNGIMTQVSVNLAAAHARALLAIADELRALRQTLQFADVRGGKRHPDLGGRR